MLKKANISVNLMIMAIIALIVLVVIVAIFAGKANTFGDSVSNCENKGGDCDEGLACPVDKPIGVWGASCPTEGEICCRPMGFGGGEKADSVDDNADDDSAD